MRRGLIVSLTSLGLLVQPSGAEDQATDSEVEEIVVLGVRPGVLAPLPTVATDEIDAAARVAENQSLPDLLSELPGVWVRRFGTVADDAEISIRGSAANQVLLTFDGVPINRLLSGVGDPAGVCLPLVERIAITRGAGAIRYGSGAVAGVVDLIPSVGDPETRIQGSGGAFETYTGSLRHANRWNDLALQLGYCGLTTEGDFEFARPSLEVNGIPLTFDPDEATRDNNDRERHAGHLGLQHPLFGGELRFTEMISYERGGSPGFDSADGIDAGQTLEARRQDLGHLAILAWQGDGLLDDALELRAYHRFESDDFRDPQPALGPARDATTRAHVFGTQLGDVWDFTLAGESQRIAFFGDAVHERIGARQSVDDSRTRGGFGAETVLRAWKERIVLSAALRLDNAEGFRSEWLPSVGLALTPVPWLRLRSHIGRGYRIPSQNELFLPDLGFARGNPALRPEDAIDFDVGLELDFDAIGPFEDVRFRGSWFHRDIDDTILWLQISPNTVSPINTGEATAEGFELSLALGLSDWIRANASYTNLDSRREATRERLPGQPRHETFVRLQLGPPEWLKLVGELQRTGTILVNEGGGRKLPDRTLWNASASLNLVPLGERLSLPELALTRAFWVYFEINNIGDEAVRDSLAFPQPGRNASVGFEGAW